MTALPRFSEHELLRRYVLARDVEHTVAVDVGAHIGLFSETFAELGWTGIAFEAEPGNAARLAERLGAYAGWEVRAQAVSDTTGTLRFHRSSEFWGIHSLAPTTASHDEVIEVDGTRLDDALAAAGIDDVGLLKVDVEGADLPVLRSFPFDRSRPAVVLAEIMDDRSREHFGWDHHEMVEFLSSHGYVSYLACWAEVQQHSREGGGGGPFDFLRCVAYPVATEPAWGNVVAVPEADVELFDRVLIDYLEELAVGVRERSTSIDGLRRTVEARDGRIDELQQAIAQRDARIEELGSAIKQRDARIDELQRAIGQRDDRIENLQRAVAQRDERLQALAPDNAGS